MILIELFLLVGKPKAFTSFSNKGVASITVFVESFLNALIGNVYKTGSKFEFTTASCTGKESDATT